jgi:hypothetical protein
MTVDIPEPGTYDANALAQYTNDEGKVYGLEDFIETGTRYPRLKFVHDEAVFMDDLDEWKTEVLDVILLGVVKQRIMFDKEVRDEDMKPQCKSLDGKTAWPNFAQDGDPRDVFPWAESHLDQSQLTVVGDKYSLSCDICPFSQWGGKGKGSKPPRCSEAMNVPCLYYRDGQWVAATINFQRSSMGAAKSYISRFAKGHVPTFSQMTRITLNSNKRGTVTYVTPNFTTTGPTDSAAYGQYAEMFGEVRDYLRTQQDDEEESDEALDAMVDNSWGTAAQADTPAAPVVPAPVAPAPPVAAPVPVAPAPPKASPPAPPRAAPVPPKASPPAPPTRPVAPPAPPRAAPAAPSAPTPPARPQSAPVAPPVAPGNAGSENDNWPFAN